MINLTTLLLGATCALSLTNEVQGRVLNGNDDSETPVIAPAQRRQFPYIVALAYKGRLICGGSILTPSWIVTSGHCAHIVNYHLRDTKVIAGALKIDESHPDIQSLHVEQAIAHPELHSSETGLVHNIGLIKLVSPLKFTEAVQQIQIPKQSQNFQGPAVIVGWTLSVKHTENIIHVFIEQSYTHNTIITNEECQDIYTNLPSNASIANGMICTGPLVKDEGGCHLGVGVPLAQNNILVGVVGLGVHCKDNLKGPPAIYTRVSEYLDFIRNYVPDV